MILGELRVQEFLSATRGEVRGRQVSDAKNRYYEATYEWQESSPGILEVWRRGSPTRTKIPAVIPLDEALVSFFGLYSGDGAKGSEDLQNPGVLRPNISFSQRESNLIRFAVQQFKIIFPEAYFVFSLGEDSAYFMDGEGLQALTEAYGGRLPPTPALGTLPNVLNEADRRYLGEVRGAQADVEVDLAFYYFHKPKMEEILTRQKALYIQKAGIPLTPRDRVTASLRRPFKKGARLPGGSSRSDETHVGNVGGVGELFLKMLHEIEASIQEDLAVSTQGLVVWRAVPSNLGEVIDLQEFFTRHSFGQLNGQRPTIMEIQNNILVGGWRRSKVISLNKFLRINPLWCYTSGLYLAEGTTDKSQLFSMYRSRVSSLGLGFTSSENTSLELILRALQQLFPSDICVDAWKVKVGSQYFPELVVVGLKNTVPMLRGGASGDGKLRTMEISLAILKWALEIAPAIAPYRAKFSHVEPTGAGVPRIDFWASSALCKWYFPLILYATFGTLVNNPSQDFIYD